MPNRTTDALFQLVHSLKKAEKRNFKLYVMRNSSNDELKVVQLFDAMEKMEEYDEALLLKRNSSLKKQQLSNIKASLYKQLLASLRLLELEANIDIQLHEQLDYARILYNKGLYLQSLNILGKIKELAKANNQLSFLVQVLFLEKKIESLHITRSFKDRAYQLSAEADQTNEQIAVITKLSNLALQLYSWYINNGHVRNEEEEATVTSFFREQQIQDSAASTSFYARLYTYQSFCWYAFIRQDFLMYYRYTQKWVDMFTDQPDMLPVETIQYIKGMHNLLNAHFVLRNYQKFTDTLQQFETFAASDLVQLNDNNRIQVFVYLYTAKINQHFLFGTFEQGLELVPQIIQKLKEYSLYLDRHRVLVFYYKLASLYFGAGDYDHTIEYLNKIINWKTDLRTDLQCYARLLHLIAHYELGNFELLEYLLRSVYRFMAKMNHLSRVEEEIFNFLKGAFYLSRSDLKAAFIKLLEKLKRLEGNRFETRAFSYLDINSWLESKIKNQPISTIIRNKYLLAVEP